MVKVKLEEKASEAAETVEVAPVSPEPLASPELELANLREQLAQAQKEAGEAKALAKKQEQLATRRANELRQTALDEKLVGLENRIGVLTDMVADIVDREEIPLEEAPRARRSEQYLSRLKKEEAKLPAAPVNVELLELAQQADDLAKAAGLEMGQSEELDKAVWLFSIGQAQRGLDEVKKVAATKQTPAKSTLTETDEAEIARAYLEKKGRLVSDIGLSTSVSRSFAQIEQAYTEGKVSYEEYAEARKKQKIL